ncbi:MAG: ornithine carbamoyltransferase [Nitrospinae bacterium]|nr:ornithine carbamoyltransferase [Nitrospinota bacterium]
MKRDLLTLLDLNKDEFNSILEKGKAYKNEAITGNLSQPLKGKTLGMIFSKTSTRTRLSFEVGMHQLGGYAIYNNRNDLQLDHGESIKATAKILSLYLDGILIRTYDQKEIVELAKSAEIPVINGLTDSYHPCQILSDVFTIKERFHDLSNINVVYVGDGNNICNSLFNGAALGGFSFTACTPDLYAPSNETVLNAQKIQKENFGDSFSIKLSSNPVESVKNAHVIYTDTWISMGMEEEKEKRLKDFKGFQVNKELLSHCKENYVVMHCLPAHENEEITPDVLESENSIVYTQAKNRLYVQKAILNFLLSNK